MTRFQIQRADSSTSIADVRIRPCRSAKPHDGKWVVELESLDDLLALIAETDSSLIIDETKITIYDVED